MSAVALKLKSTGRRDETAVTSELANFLLARIAEDEEVALQSAESYPGVWTWDRKRQGDVACDGHYSVLYQDSTDDSSTPHILRWQPQRVLVECEAKRKAVQQLLGWPDKDVEHWAIYEAVAFLALPYANHPDYREEWTQ
jgi:hypothetical protein